MPGGQQKSAQRRKWQEGGPTGLQVRLKVLSSRDDSCRTNVQTPEPRGLRGEELCDLRAIQSCHWGCSAACQPHPLGGGLAGERESLGALLLIHIL